MPDDLARKMDAQFKEQRKHDVLLPRIEHYVPIPPIQVVQAVQFVGWENAKFLWEWADQKIFYVPEGFAHPFRYQDEWEMYGQTVWDWAPEFLIIKTKDGEIHRCSLGWWLLKHVNAGMGFSVMTQHEFENSYTVVEGWGNPISR